VAAQCALIEFAKLFSNGRALVARRRLDFSSHLLHAAHTVNLPEYRKAIDKLDAQAVRLLNERTKQAFAIGEV
jgi:hypothetical protein